jgi:tRNA pseudouridine38-40 synthase
MRVRAVVAYDGTDYHGFQRQALEREPSIQGTLERALATIGQKNVTVLGSGRTDAGVHASGQVVAFDVEWAHGVVALQRAINATLPPSIVVLDLEEAAPDFQPRYDAFSRQYRYTIYNAPVRHPLFSRYAWHVPDALNVEWMQQASQSLIGEHDFAAFGLPTDHQGGPTVRQVHRVECWRENEIVYIEVEANGFLYRMMRSMVGTLTAVGLGKLNVEAVREILEARHWGRVKLIAPPQGLCLTRVRY